MTSIHITEVLSSLKIIDLLEKYPNLEKITCSPSVYNRTSNRYIEALNQLDIDVVKEYHWGASKKPCDYEDELLQLASEGYKSLRTLAGKVRRMRILLYLLQALDQLLGPLQTL